MFKDEWSAPPSTAHHEQEEAQRGDGVMNGSSRHGSSSSRRGTRRQMLFSFPSWNSRATSSPDEHESKPPAPGRPHQGSSDPAGDEESSHGIQSLMSVNTAESADRTPKERRQPPMFKSSGSNDYQREAGGEKKKGDEEKKGDEHKKGAEKKNEDSGNSRTKVERSWSFDLLNQFLESTPDEFPQDTGEPRPLAPTERTRSSNSDSSVPVSVASRERSGPGALVSDHSSMPITVGVLNKPPPQPASLNNSQSSSIKVMTRPPRMTRQNSSVSSISDGLSYYATASADWSSIQSSANMTNESGRKDSRAVANRPAVRRGILKASSRFEATTTPPPLSLGSTSNPSLGSSSTATSAPPSDPSTLGHREALAVSMAETSQLEYMRASEPGAVQLAHRAPGQRPSRCFTLGSVAEASRTSGSRTSASRTSSRALSRVSANSNNDNMSLIPPAMTAMDELMLAETVEPPKPPVDRRRRKLMWLSCVGVVGFVILIIGVVMVITSKAKRTPKPQTPAGAMPISAPSHVPTGTPIYVLSGLFGVLEGYSESQEFRDPSSAQYKASNWLANTDDFIVDDGPALRQRYAIAVLYYSTTANAPNHRLLDWMRAKVHECDWSPYIVCETSGLGNREVVSIDLTRMGLERGRIPPEIGLLPKLERLILRENDLVGTIPDGLSRLKSLIILDMSDNRLESELPAGAMNGWTDKLESLDLSNNELTGTIPKEIFRLQELRELNLGHNMIGGPVSLSFGNLTKMTRLTLVHNQMEGTIPPMFESLPDLRVCNLDHNLLTGRLPAETVDFLAKREEMTVSNNLLTGAVPNPFPYDGDVTDKDLVDVNLKLKRIDISDNDLSGTLPEMIAELPNLRSFDVAGNRLSGTIMSNLSGSDILVYLDLSRNLFKGSLPTRFGQRLEHFDVSYNLLTSTFPPAIVTLRDLTHLSVASNPGMSGAFPSDVSGLRSLQFLGVGNCSLSGFLPDSIGSLTHLEHLQVEMNTLNGTLPSQFRRLTKLRTLLLQANRLEGTLPPALGRLTALEKLTLSNNNFTGTIPRELQSLGQLKSLVLNGNMLVGTIPRGVCNMMTGCSNLEEIIVDESVDCSCCEAEKPDCRYEQDPGRYLR